MKTDELALWDCLMQNKGIPVWPDAADMVGMNYKRADGLAVKWFNRGLWVVGVSVRCGWFSPFARQNLVNDRGYVMANKAKGEFGFWLRGWRKENRWSITAFAKLIGMSKSYIWELETGKEFNPSLSTLMKISAATGTAFTRVAVLAATQKRNENED